MEDSAYYRDILPAVAYSIADHRTDLEEEHEYQGQKGRSVRVYAGGKFSSVEPDRSVLISHGEQEQTPEGEQFRKRRQRDAKF